MCSVIFLLFSSNQAAAVEMTAYIFIIFSYDQLEVLSTVIEVRGHLVIQEQPNSSFPHLRNLRAVNNTKRYQGKDLTQCFFCVYFLLHQKGMSHFFDLFLSLNTCVDHEL